MLVDCGDDGMDATTKLFVDLFHFFEQLEPTLVQLERHGFLEIHSCT